MTKDQQGSSFHQCEVWKRYYKNYGVYCAHKVSHSESQCWPWPLALIQIQFDSTTYMWSLIWKWLRKSCSLLYHTHKVLQSAKVDLDFWPHYPKSISFLLSLTTYCEVWKWLNKKCSLYHAHKVLQRVPKAQSWPWPLTLWPKVKRIFLLIINNFCVKFENDCTKLKSVSHREKYYESCTHTPNHSNSHITFSPQYRCKEIMKFYWANPFDAPSGTKNIFQYRGVEKVKSFHHTNVIMVTGLPNKLMNRPKDHFEAFK